MKTHTNPALIRTLHRRLKALSIILPLAASHPAVAQSTWTTNTAGTTNWSAGTWTGGVPTSGTTTAINFFDTGTTLGAVAITANNDLTPNPFLVNNLTIAGIGPSGGAASLTLQGNALQFDGTSAQLNINNVVGSGGTYAVTIANALTFNTATAINFTGTGTVTTSGAWAGAGNVTFTGNSTARPLSLGVTGTFTGDLTLSGANSVLRLNGAVSNVLGTNAATTQSVIVSSGSGVNMDYVNGGRTHNQNFILNGNGNVDTSNAALNVTRVNFGNGTTGGLALLSNSTVRVVPEVAGGTAGMAVTRGLVGSGNLTKTGGGYLYLSAAGTSNVTWGGTSFTAFTGDVAINEGVIQSTQTTNIFGSNVAGTQRVTVASGAAMVINASNNAGTQPQNFILNGGGTGYGTNNGGIAALSSFGVGFNNNGLGSIGLQTDASIAVTKNAGAGNFGLTTTNGIVGTGTMTVGGSYGANIGTLFANIASPVSIGLLNTFSGKVVVNNGIINVGNATALGATSANQIYLSGLGTVSSSLAGGLDQAFLARIFNASTSGGIIALGANSANNLDFSGTPNLRLGSVGAFTYSGTLTPSGTTYRLGGGSGTLTVSSDLTGASNALNVGGTVALTGAGNTFGGGITIAGNNTGADHGARLNFTGGTGVLPSNALTFGGIGGTFAYTGAATGSSQSMGSISFGEGLGQVTSTYGTSGNTSLDFSSLTARTAGATGNFSTTGGTNGTTNKISIAGLGTGFVDKGIFFGGSNYAYNDASGYLRAAVYGTDAGFVTSGATTSLASATHQQITGAISAQTTASFSTLRIGGAFGVTLAASQILSTDGILKTGTTANIAGGSGIQTATAGGEMVVRTDVAADVLAITTAILDNSTSSLTKSGAGTLTLSGTNTYTGGTTISQGTLTVSAGGLADTGAINVTGGTYNVNVADTVGAVTLKNGIIGGSAALTGSSYTVQNGQVNTILAGSGNLTKSGTGAVLLTSNNTYTGTTTISQGSLILSSATLNNNLAGSTNLIVGSTTGADAVLNVLNINQGGFMLAAGQILSGHGRILGNVAIGNGILSPGVSGTGVLTFDGKLTASSASAVNFNINGTTRGTGYDAVNVGGQLTYGGTMTLNFGSSFLDTTNGAVTSFTLFSNVDGSGVPTSFGTSALTSPISVVGSYTASLTSVGGGVWQANSGGFDWSFTEATGLFTATAVPESSTYAALAGVCILGFSVYRRRRV